MHMQYTCSAALAIPCPTNTLPPAVAYLVYHGAPTENIRVPYGSVGIWNKVLYCVSGWQAAKARQYPWQADREQLRRIVSGMRP